MGKIRVFLATLLFSSLTQAAPLISESLGHGVYCFRDGEDSESANSFLIQDAKLSMLIDAGWSDASQVPVGFLNGINKSLKVATHFHSDHIRQWPSLQNIYLSEKQEHYCKDRICKPSRFQTIKPVKSFVVKGVFADGFPVSSEIPRIVALSCGGHSQTDTCYIDKMSRTLFLGDLFYEGPVFYFLPGGSLKLANSSLDMVLARSDWDFIAITHGPCRASRSQVIQFKLDLQKIVNGEVSWSWDFSFAIPLWVYRVISGSVITRPIFQ